MGNETFSRIKKERYLLSFSEDSFRDEIIRPLLARLNFKDGRDLCGPDELGKDAVFLFDNPLSLEVYVVQTKKGNLKMSHDAKTNVLNAITQLKMALETKVSFSFEKTKKYPDRVMLCISGKINAKAKSHIIEELKDNRIIFMDADDIINKIDDKFPELWMGIDKDLLPYLREIKRSVEDISYSKFSSDFLPKSDAPDAATDEMYVPLKLYRTTVKSRKFKGRLIQEPDFEEIPFQGIMSRKQSLFLILGEAGSGKSTALRRLAYQVANKSIEQFDKYKIPILLKANEVYNKCNKLSLAEICNEETIRLTDSKKSSFSNTDLTEGRVLIMIDGLDEVSTNEQRKLVLNAIINFHKVFNKCKIILTSRDYSFIKDLPGINIFLEYRINPISFKEVDKILKRFQKRKTLSEETSKEILRRLQEIHGMELNPLLVTVFAATSDYSRKDIPANITELFKKFTEIMLGRWDESKGLSQQFHAPLKDFVLTQIGFELHRRRITSISIDEFYEIIKQELGSRGHIGDVEQISDEIINRSGLFRVVQNNIEFRHHVLQEFFAGRGIPSNDFLISIITDEWWQRAIVFYFGDKPGESNGIINLISVLKSRPKDEIFVASLTIGLAIQAAYLIKVDKRLDFLKWVITGLSQAKDDFLDFISDKLPLSRFIYYYLAGRDSVACSFVADHIDLLFNDLVSTNSAILDKEVNSFWLIISLLESHEIEKAEFLIKNFHPKELKLLLAIHLSCFIIINLKIVSKEKKKTAEKILSYLDKRIFPLREQLLNEYTSELLELRNGQIKAIDEGQKDSE